jgi:Mrp family chromosome partitioning ATPase
VSGEPLPDLGSNGWWSAGQRVPGSRSSIGPVPADESRPRTPTTPQPRRNYLRPTVSSAPTAAEATEAAKTETAPAPGRTAATEAATAEAAKVETPPAPQPTAATETATAEAAKVETPPAPQPSGDRASRRRQQKRSSGQGAPVWVNARPEVLRSCAVALRRMGDEVGSIGVTSTVHREGRTTIAMGMAEAVAANGRNAILVDLDLQRPRGRGAPAEQDVAGVRQILSGAASSDECLRRIGEHLQVIHAGRFDAGENVVRSDRIADLITDLARRCDVVVADLPSLQSGVDAARMSDEFESVVLVVRAGGVTIPEIEESVSVLGGRPVVVLNGKGRAKRTLFGRKKGL